MQKDEFLLRLQEKANRRVSPKFCTLEFGGDVQRTEGAPLPPSLREASPKGTLPAPFGFVIHNVLQILE